MTKNGLKRREREGGSAPLEKSGREKKTKNKNNWGGGKKRDRGTRQHRRKKGPFTNSPSSGGEGSLKLPGTRKKKKIP